MKERSFFLWNMENLWKSSFARYLYYGKLPHPKLPHPWNTV